MPSTTPTAATVPPLAPRYTGRHLPPPAARDDLHFSLLVRLGGLVSSLPNNDNDRDRRRLCDMTYRLEYCMPELDSMALGRAVRFPSLLPGHTTLSIGGRPQPEQARQILAHVARSAAMIGGAMSGTAEQAAALQEFGLRNTNFAVDLRAMARDVAGAAVSLDMVVYFLPN